MEERINLLMKNTTEILEGIFSEPITESEFELVEVVFYRAFTSISNSNDAFVALSIFNKYMQILLTLFMDGYGEKK